MSTLTSAFAAASASGALPWMAAGALALAITIGGGGFWAGHHWAVASCDNEKLASQVAAQTHQAEAVAKAQATSDKLWTIGIALNVDLAVQRERATARTHEVIRYVDATPDLGRSVVPAGVQRVRDEQVRDSAELAAGRSVRR